MPERPYTAAEAAERLGLTRDYFYREYARLVAEGMPPSLTARGHYRFERAGFDAWRTRHHPLAPRLPAANDTHASPPPVADQAWRERLKLVYGGAR